MPAALLAANGFENIREIMVPAVEAYSIAHAVLYAQSMSIWNLVSSKARSHALQSIKNKFESDALNGIVKRFIEVNVVSAFKQ